MAKKRVIVTPNVGDVVTMRSWSSDWIDVRVTKIGSSPIYGETVEGSMVVDGMAHRSVALPLSHLIETAKVTRIGHGKWDVEFPDGKLVRSKSKRAAQELCQSRGVVFQEV